MCSEWQQEPSIQRTEKKGALNAKVELRKWVGVRGDGVKIQIQYLLRKRGQHGEQRKLDQRTMRWIYLPAGL